MFIVAALITVSAQATVYDDIVHQAYYALDQSASGASSKTISGNYAGDWNWLYSDSFSYGTVKGWYLSGCYASDWAVSGDSCPQLAGWVSFYSNPSGYGYVNSASPIANWYGRGGQCVYFVDLVLYRAGIYTGGLNVGTMNSQSLPLSYAQPGYVLQRYNVNNNPINHVAIIVGVTRDGSGTVIAITVVDSNWVSDNGPDMEINRKAHHLESGPFSVESLALRILTSTLSLLKRRGTASPFFVMV